MAFWFSCFGAGDSLTEVVIGRDSEGKTRISNLSRIPAARGDKTKRQRLWDIMADWFTMKYGNCFNYHWGLAGISGHGLKGVRGWVGRDNSPWLTDIALEVVFFQVSLRARTRFQCLSAMGFGENWILERHTWCLSWTMDTWLIVLAGPTNRSVPWGWQEKFPIFLPGTVFNLCFSPFRWTKLCRLMFFLWVCVLEWGKCWGNLWLLLRKISGFF